MKELVIFSSPLISILIAVTVLLHIASVVLRKVMAGNESIRNIISSVLAILNLVTHGVIFVICLYLKASPEEMLFITMLSSAVAITATNIGREEE